ncbi:unnamed protein product, partial [Rotaria socialis]
MPGASGITTLASGVVKVTPSDPGLRSDGTVPVLAPVSWGEP